MTSGKVANGTLDASDLAADSVAASELADDSVDTAAIQADAVTGAKVATGTLDATDLAADSVAASELANDAVDTAAIQTGAVTSGKIANDAVNTAQVADASTTAGVGLKQADIGLAGTFTVTPGSSITSSRCSDFATTVSGVAANDMVMLTGPTGASTTGYSAQVVSTASNQITVRICNLTGSNAGNGVNFGFRYVAVH